MLFLALCHQLQNKNNFNIVYVATHAFVTVLSSLVIKRRTKMLNNNNKNVQNDETKRHNGGIWCAL